MNAIHYDIFPQNPHAHLFEIRCHVAHPDPKGQQFYLPTWTIGSYLIREFARHIVEIRAEAGGNPLKLIKTNKNTWQAIPTQEKITVIYSIYAKELSVRTAYLDAQRAFFNGSNVFLAVKNQESQPCSINIDYLQTLTKLNIATTLQKNQHLYYAENYFDLIDHPVEISSFVSVDFNAANIPHQMIISGQTNVDLNKLAHDLQKICETIISFWGETPPFQKYLFLVHSTNNAYGGLEHQDCTALICNREDLPILNQPLKSENYQRFLGLCSHEYFHAWHVKKIKPASFQSIDLNQEIYTHQLWIFEGITSYYDDLLLLRSGCISQQDYLILVAQNITRVWRSIGRFKQSIADASFDAWIKAYRPDENTPNATVSYYAKGAMVALALDLKLRLKSKIYLDDIMKYLWNEYGLKNKGLQDGEFENIVEQLSGLDLKDFFEQYVYGTQDPPLKELFAEFGISLQAKAADSQQDNGGKISKIKKISSLGLRYKTKGDFLKITHVFNNSAAEQAGLSANDLIVSINGIKATANRLEQCGLLEANTSLEIHIFRNESLQLYRLVLQSAPLDTCVLTLENKVSQTIEKRRQQWLMSSK
jgi:predicted metalloprotease with PDZ domain